MTVRSQFPGLGHHDAEVLISVNGGRNITVVLAKLIEGDNSIGNLRIPHAHELTIGFLRSFLAVDNVGVLAHIIDASDIVKGHLTILVNIKLLVCSSNETDSVLAEVSAEGPKELIKVYTAITVAIEVSDKHLDLLVREVDIVVNKAILKLVGVELPVSIIIQDAEDAANTTDCHRTSPLQGVLDVLHHLGAIVPRGSFDGCGSSGIRRQLNGPEVLWVDSLILSLTDSLSVVLTGEHLCLVFGGG